MNDPGADLTAFNEQWGSIDNVVTNVPGGAGAGAGGHVRAGRGPPAVACGVARPWAAKKRAGMTRRVRLACLRREDDQAGGSLANCSCILASVALKLSRRSRSCATTAAGRARDEAFAGQLAVGLGDLALEARDLLLQALALGGDVDLDLQHQLGGADDRHRGRRIRQRVDDLHFRQLAQQLDVGREALRGGAVGVVRPARRSAARAPTATASFRRAGCGWRRSAS